MRASTRSTSARTEKIQSIDKDVKAAPSAEDLAAKLHGLGVWMRAQ